MEPPSVSLDFLVPINQVEWNSVSEIHKSVVQISKIADMQCVILLPDEMSRPVRRCWVAPRGEGGMSGVLVPAAASG